MTESWLFKGRAKAKAKESDGAVSHEEPGHRIPSDDEGVNATTRYRPRRQHTLKEAMAKAVDDFIVKGDVAGHDFHGNQYTMGGGSSLRDHLSDAHNIETKVGPSSKWDDKRLSKYHEQEHAGAHRSPGLGSKPGVAGGHTHGEKGLGIYIHQEYKESVDYKSGKGGLHEHPKAGVLHEHSTLGSATNDKPHEHSGLRKLIDADLAKDWGTAAPQGSTMPAIGLQDTNLGPGQKKARCLTCGKVKCKCR